MKKEAEIKKRKLADKAAEKPKKKIIEVSFAVQWLETILGT